MNKISEKINQYLAVNSVKDLLSPSLSGKKISAIL